MMPLNHHRVMLRMSLHWFWATSKGGFGNWKMETERTGGCFSCRCEQLLIRRLLNDPQAAERDLQWCYEHILEATVEQMMVLTGS